MPLLKNTLKSGERVVVVSPEGKPSLSYFHFLRGCDRASDVEISLKTGRTHQIRVHAQASGHPVLGDEKYGERAANQHARRCGLKRLALHAWRLGFVHPITEKPMEIEAPLPSIFDTTLSCLCEKAHHE